MMTPSTRRTLLRSIGFGRKYDLNMSLLLLRQLEYLVSLEPEQGGRWTVRCAGRWVSAPEPKHAVQLLARELFESEMVA